LNRRGQRYRLYLPSEGLLQAATLAAVLVEQDDAPLGDALAA